MHESPARSAAKAGRYAFAALLLSNLFLAFGPWFVRLSDTGPVASAFWRLALAAPLLLLFVRPRGGQKLEIRGAIIATIIVGGLFFAADLAAWHYGIMRTKLANATLFGNSSSFLFAIYGFLIARALPRPMQVVALLLAAVGTAFLLGSSYELSEEHLTGDLFALLAGLFYTFYLIAINRARRTLAPMPVLALATIAGTAPLLILALLLGERIVPEDWTPLVLLALSSQVIGQGLLVYAVGHLSPVVVGLALLTQPAVSALIGWLAYDERLSTADAAGALMICIALVLIRLPHRVAPVPREGH